MHEVLKRMLEETTADADVGGAGYIGGLHMLMHDEFVFAFLVPWTGNNLGWMIRLVPIRSVQTPLRAEPNGWANWSPLWPVGP